MSSVQSVSPITVRRARVRWTRIGPALFVATAVAQVDKISIAVVIANAAFLRTMGLMGHPAGVGALVTAFLAAYGVGLFLWGFLIDALGPRRSAVIAVLLWSVMLAWGGLSTSLGELFASRIGLGLTEGILFPVCNAFVARWFPWSERGRAQSFWFNGATIGAAVGGAVATALIVAAGWRAMFLVLAAAGLVIVVPMLWWMTQDDPEHDPRVTEVERQEIRAQIARPPARPVAEVLRDYRYWLLVLAVVDARLSHPGPPFLLCRRRWGDRLDVCAGGHRGGGDGGSHRPHRTRGLVGRFGVRCGRGGAVRWGGICRRWGWGWRP